MTVTASPPFLLDLTATCGRGMVKLSSEDGGFDLCQWTSWLRIRSDVSGYVALATAPGDEDMTGFVPPVFENDGLAVLVVSRSAADLSETPVGLFYRRLDADELEKLRRVVEMTPWLELPHPAGGHHAAPQLTIHYASGEYLVHREFNALCGNFIEAIAPLWELLRYQQTLANRRPTATLAVEVRAERTSEDDPNHWKLSIKLVNEGTDPIVLTDPRIAKPGSHSQSRIELRIGALESSIPGAPPYTWNVLPLPPPSVDPTLVLARRGSFELCVPWVAPGPGRYLLEGSWQDYEGPVKQFAGQLPFMPLPERGPSALGGGPYPLRGAAFANRLIEVPEKRQR
jgi:hypothetical protein